MGTKKKQILIVGITLVIIFMLGGLIKLLATEDVEDLADQVVELTVEEKKEKIRDDNPKAKEYLVTDENISRVLPKTKVEDFVSNFGKEEKVKIYTDSTCSKEVTSGEVYSGMYAKYENNERIFEISVLGDINKAEKQEENSDVLPKQLSGDGELNEIECTRIIRGTLNTEKWKIEEDTELKSADITCNQEIDELDVQSAIEYIVFGNIEASKAEKVEEPSLTVVEGIKSEDGSFIGSAKVKLIQNDEKGTKNIYRIVRNQEEYLEIANNGIIELNNPGTYTIVAYTYGELNNKSKGELKTVVVGNGEFNLTLVAGENIVKVEGSGKYQVGETVQIKATVKENGNGYEYTWGSWISESEDLVANQAAIEAEIIMPKSNITLTANALRSLVDYSITYNLNGGVVEKENPTTYTVETPTFILNNPSKEGFSFDGWTTKDDKEPNKTVSIESGSIGNKIYTAQWTELPEVTYKVEHYKENIEGSEYVLAETEEFQAKVGKKVQAAIKEYEGFTYDNANSDNLLEDTIKENEEVILKVYYKRNSYELTLEKNDNIESVEGAGIYKYEAPVNINAILKEENGYRFVFDKWETSDSALLVNQASQTTNFIMPAGELTLTAIGIKYAREDIEYDIEYYYQENGTYSSEPTKTITKVGTTDTKVQISETDKVTSKVGYIFDENNSSNILEGTVDANQKLVLKLYFKQQLKVSYSAGDYGTFETETTRGIDYGAKTPVFVGELTCEQGYSFKGWDKEVGENVTEDIEYVATWEPIVYKITYNLNNGIIDGENPTTYTVEDEDITLINPTKNGYIFEGWTGTEIDGNSTEVKIESRSTGDRAYTANWKKEKYKITYELNGGNVENENPTEYTVETPTFTLYNPVKVGYEFIGWTGTGLEEKETTVMVETGSFGDREYEANWSKNSGVPYTIKYFLEDLNAETYTCVDTLNLSGTTEDFVEAEIKIFEGFTFDSENKNNNLSGNILGNGTLELRVYYSRNTYNLTLYTEKENNIDVLVLNAEEAPIEDLDSVRISDSFEYGEKIEIDAILKDKVGYTYSFLEWTTSDANLLTTQTNKSNTFTMPAGDLTLTAKATETPLIEGYIVEYYYEKADGSYAGQPTETDTSRTGLVGTTAVVEESDKISTKEGYSYDTTAANVLTTTILGDGTAKLKIYFARNIYTLKLNAGSNIETITLGETIGNAENPIEEQFKYGETVEIDATVMQEAGYAFEFEQWKSSNEELLENQEKAKSTFTVPAGNLELTATATKTAEDVKYTIEYYYEENGMYPETPEDTITRTGKTETSVNITSADKVSMKDNYVYDVHESNSETINGDETTVIKVYFKQQFTVTYESGEKGTFEIVEITGIRYGENTPLFTDEITGEDGFIFVGWEPTIAETVTENATYVAQWSEITMPTITHSPTTWTNQDVAVTITAPEEMKNLDIEYRVGTASVWTKYQGVFNISENTTIYARLTDGSKVGEEAIHEITNIDKVVPTVENGEIDTSNENVAIITATLKDNLSGVVKYGISTSDTLEPEYITCSNTLESAVEFEEIYENGTYYIWVQDAAGNITKQQIIILHIKKYMVARIVDTPEGYETLIGTEYETLEEALSISDEAAQTGNVKIEIIHSIYNEDNTILNGRDYTIDLHDYEIRNQKETPTLTVAGKLNIVDEGINLTGKVLSVNGDGVYIALEGEFTLGVDEESSNPSTISPIIEGKEYGVQKEINENVQKDEETGVYPEGIFNFYDGKIIGQIAIKAQKIDDTPLLYDPTVITNSDIEKQESTLAVVSGIEAVIGKKRYMLVEEAIEDANNNIGDKNTQIEITIVKDISKESEILVDSSKNIKLDLNGHVFTTTASGYVIRNQGQLEIIDSSETIDETTGEIINGTGVIVNTTAGAIKNETATDGVELEYENLDLSEVVSNGDYYFESRAEGLISNNVGVASTANSYIEVDLTEKYGLYEVCMNVTNAPSTKYDYSYVTVTKDTTAPDYSSTIGRKLYTNTAETQQNHKFNLLGGEKYYIHLGYYNYNAATTNGDYFAIHSIKVAPTLSKIGTVTLTSGEIRNEKAGTKNAYSTAIENEGEIYVNGGRITSTQTYSTLIENAKTTNASFVQINSGELTGAYAGIRNYYGGILDVYGAEMQIAQTGIMNYGKVNMYGGTINSTSSYCLANYNYGKIVVENGNLMGANGIHNGAQNYEYDNILIKNVAIDVNNYAISNNSTGIIHIENATVNKCTMLVYSNSSSQTIIDNITANAVDDNGKSKIRRGFYFETGGGTVTINNGNIFVNTDISYITRSGTLNINGGTIKTEYTGSAINMYPDYAGARLNISGGIIETAKTTVAQGSGDIINITGGTIISNDIAISNGAGTTNIGIKDATAYAEELLIKGATAGITNYTGIVNYYDGTLVGPEDYPLAGSYNEIEENYEIVKEVKEDGLQYVTLGIPTEYVARISESHNPDVSILDSKYYKLENGYYYFTTLNSAVEACNTTNQTTIELIAKQWIYRTITVDENQDIIIDLKDNTLRIYGILGFENFGKLQIVNSTEGTYGNIYSNTNNVIENEENAEMKINNICLDYYQVLGNSSNYAKTIMNNGNLEILNTNLKATQGYNRKCYTYNVWSGETGTLKVNGLIVESNVRSDLKIYNAGVDKEDEDGNIIPSLIVENSNIYNNGYTTTGINNISTGSVYVKKSTIAQSTAIVNSSSGYIEIEDCTTQNYVVNSSTGKILIKGEETKGQKVNNDNAEGTLEIQAGYFNTSGTVITNSGKLIVTGGTFISGSSYYDDYRGISNKSTGVAEVSGVNTYIEGTVHGIYNEGIITIKEATVKSWNRAGITNASSGTLNLGIKDGNVEFQPIVYGGTYGVYNNGTFNFYDGIIEAPTNQSIGVKLDVTEEEYVRVIHSGEVTYDDGTEAGYTVASGREISVLEKIEVAHVASTNKNYTSFEAALADTADTDTITVLTDATIVSSKDSLVIEETKNITLDLAGYTIAAGNSHTFVNNGTLVIKDSTTYENAEGNAVSGTISNGVDILIQNNGDLTVEDVTLKLTTAGTKSEYKKLIENNGTANIKSGVLTTTGGYSYVVYNTENATTNIGSATISPIDSSSYAIYNIADGNVATNGSDITGTIENNETGIIDIENSTVTRQVYNQGTGSINIKNSSIDYSGTAAVLNNSTGTINITGGTITGNGVTIHNYGAGDINIDGTQSGVTIKARISQTSYAIRNNSTGTIDVQGNVEIITDTTTRYSVYGIYNVSTGTIILGDKDNVTNNVTIDADDIGVYNPSGIFKYYGGTIEADSKAVEGKITARPEGYRVEKTVGDANEEIYKIVLDDAVCSVGDKSYNTLQQAITNTEEGTIKIEKDIVLTEMDIITIDDNKDIILDLNNHIIQGHTHSTVITNNGSLKITDNSTEATGTIQENGASLILNKGNLEIAGGNINVGLVNSGKMIYNTEDGTVSVTGGYITQTEGRSTQIIYSDNTSKVVMSGGTISVLGIGSSSYINAGICIAAEGGSAEIIGGEITGSGSYNVGVEAKATATIDISEKANINTYRGIQVSSASAEINIDGGIIENTAVHVLGQDDVLINIRGGNLGSIQSGSSNNNTVLNIYDGATISASTQAIQYIGTTNIYGGEINGYVYMYGKETLNMMSGTITGGKYGVYVSGGVTANITGGTITANEGPGIYINDASTTVNVGENTGGYPSVTVPEITGSTYGVNNVSGTFNFYDGILKGSTYAINGTVTSTPEVFTVNYSEEGTVATLGIIATFEQVALVNGIYYDDLTSAITAAITTNAKVEICKDIVLQESVEIPSGSAITIDLCGNSIYGYTENAMIVNNGNLTIIDSDANLADATIYSSVKNNMGTAIENNGTLAIGQDDGTVNENSPRIIGTTVAIANNGILQFLDGQIGITDTANAVGIVTGSSDVVLPTGYTVSVSGWNYILETAE